jgi:hypothetical protein
VAGAKAALKQAQALFDPRSELLEDPFRRHSGIGVEPFGSQYPGFDLLAELDFHIFHNCIKSVASKNYLM